MSPKEFEKALDQIEFTQSSFARLMGVNPRQARRWIAGVSPIPQSVVIILELWCEGKIKTRYLAKWADQ